MQSASPAAPGAVLDRAIAAHLAGNLSEAQELYQAVLAGKPDDPVALQLLGVSHIQQGQAQAGILFLEQALRLRPDYADAHYNLGCALEALGRLDAAIAHYEAALALNPGNPAAQLNLGNALQALGRHDEAIAHYQQTLALKPEDADAYNNWGNSLQALHRHEAAIACYEKALALKPGHAQAHNNLANSLPALDRHEDAIAHYEQAIALSPGFADAHNNLGYLLQDMQRFDEALDCFVKALALKPDFAEAHNNWGMALQALNRHDEAIAHYEHAIALKPGYAEAQWNKSLALLRLGRFEEAWPLYEKRWQLKGTAALPDAGRPLWHGRSSSAGTGRGQPGAGRDGEPGRNALRRRGMPRAMAFLRTLIGRGDAQSGAKLLLQYEQGFGDAIQMLRYVPLLEQIGMHCCLQLPPALMALAQRSFPRSQVVAPDQCPAEVEFRFPMMSLPLALQTFSERDIPCAVPYLVADAKKKSEWASRLATGRARTVALAWRGRPTHKSDRNRSIPLAVLKPLLSRREIRFVTLQKDLTDAESRELARYDNVIALDRELESFDETAAIVSVVDLVISVDSSLAHLSGALGKATWVLLQFSPDWRWLLARSDSPWYPSARLFRQEAIGDWPRVVHAVGDALALASPP